MEPSQFEELSAQFDGELDPQAAARVQRLLGAEPAWRQARAELEALDRALEAWDVPAARGDLAERVIRGLPRRRPVVARLAKWLIPAAAAAAVVLAIVWWTQPRATTRPRAPAPRGRTISMAILGYESDGSAELLGPAQPEVIAEYDAVEQLAREHLGFFQDYDVLANFETLQAIDELVSAGPGA